MKAIPPLRDHPAAVTMDFLPSDSVPLPDVDEVGRAAYDRAAAEILESVRAVLGDGKNYVIDRGTLGIRERCPDCSEGWRYDRIGSASPGRGGIFQIPADTIEEFIAHDFDYAVEFQNDPVVIHFLAAQICNTCSGDGQLLKTIVDVHPTLLKMAMSFDRDEGPTIFDHFDRDAEQHVATEEAE